MQPVGHRLERSNLSIRPDDGWITAASTDASSGLHNELSVVGADNSDDWIGGFLQTSRRMAFRNLPEIRGQTGLVLNENRKPFLIVMPILCPFAKASGLLTDS
jgi:hypothetical protein